MVYEFRQYRDENDFEEERDLGVIVWETDEPMTGSSLRICGKLVNHLMDDRDVDIPEGIETVGYSFLVKSEWGGWYSNVESVSIPASVKTIEEGAFAHSGVSCVSIHPDSPCGVVRDNGVFTRDGKTLLWIMGGNSDGGDEYVVPNGVERLAAYCIAEDCIRTLVIPQSVTSIAIGEDDDVYDGLVIKAPEGSFAASFAQDNNIEFESV